MIGLIDKSDLPALAPFRARSGWQCAPGPVADSWWLKLPLDDEELFTRLPFRDRFSAEVDGQLYREGANVPEYKIDPSSWQPVAQVIQPGAPGKTAPAMPPFPVGFGLVKCDREQSAGALLCRWEGFVEWSESVLVQRFECLSFAKSESGMCLVTGSPLPGLDGQTFYQTGPLWIPSGYALPEFLQPGLVAKAMQLGSGDGAIILPEGDWEILKTGAFVKGARETIRINQ